MHLHTMIERANAQLAKRKANLQETLEAIQLVEPLEAATPGAYRLKELYTKRDRQANAVRATEGLIKAYNTALKKPTK